MNTPRLALILSLAATFFWTAKAVAIGIAGGLDRSPLESPLFLLGFVSFLAAGVTTGLALTRDRSRLASVLAAIGCVLAGIMTAGIGGSVAAAIQPANPSWVWGEVNLWVAMLAMVALNLMWVTPRQRLSAVPRGALNV